MIPLERLIRFQTVFAVASLLYLSVSLIRREATGEALSAAAIGPSMLMFIAFLGVLWLGHIGHVGWYRIGMIPALFLFGGGGVVGNAMRYFESGLDNYASFSAFLIAIGINGIGTILNFIGALDCFPKEEP